MQILTKSNVQNCLNCRRFWLNFCCDFFPSCLSVRMFLLDKNHVALILQMFLQHCQWISQDDHGASCALLNNTLYLCFGDSITLAGTHRGSLLWLMSPDLGSTKGNLCCKTILRPNKYVCTDKLPMVSSLISCCCFYNSNCVYRDGCFFFFVFLFLFF